VLFFFFSFFFWYFASLLHKEEGFHPANAPDD
jgi:hypothetical protein